MTAYATPSFSPAQLASPSKKEKTSLTPGRRSQYSRGAGTKKGLIGHVGTEIKGMIISNGMMIDVSTTMELLILCSDVWVTTAAALLQGAVPRHSPATSTQQLRLPLWRPVKQGKLPSTQLKVQYIIEDQPFSHLYFGGQASDPSSTSAADIGLCIVLWFSACKCYAVCTLCT